MWEGVCGESGGGQHIERWRHINGEKSREIEKRDGEKERDCGGRWREEVKRFEHLFMFKANGSPLSN